MASAKEYGYFIKGQKLALIEKDTALDIDVNIQSIQALEKSYERKEIKFNSYQLRLKLLSENISPNNIDNWVSTFMSVQSEPITL